MPTNNVPEDGQRGSNTPNYQYFLGVMGTLFLKECGDVLNFLCFSKDKIQ